MSEPAWMPRYRRDFAEAGREKRELMSKECPPSAQLRAEIEMRATNGWALFSAYVDALGRPVSDAEWAKAGFGPGGTTPGCKPY